MSERLNTMVDELGSLQTKLILVVGPPRSGKTKALCALALHRSMRVVNLSARLGQLLVALPRARRPIEAFEKMRELLDGTASDDLVLIDNIELLFDRTLKLDPLDTLRRHAHTRRIVATWPGELKNGRLTYASPGHPEHQDYAAQGLVTLELEFGQGA